MSDVVQQILVTRRSRSGDWFQIRLQVHTETSIGPIFIAGNCLDENPNENEAIEELFEDLCEQYEKIEFFRSAVISGYQYLRDNNLAEESMEVRRALRAARAPVTTAKREPLALRRLKNFNNLGNIERKNL